MSRVNIKPTDCKFIINREKNKVVCIYEGCEEKLWNMLCHMGIANYCYIYKDDSLLPNRFVGIATCSETDEWNEELGKRIAFLRMRKKFYTAFFNVAKKFVGKIDDMLARAVDEFNAFGERVEYNINRESARIKEQIHE